MSSGIEILVLAKIFGEERSKSRLDIFFLKKSMRVEVLLFTKIRLEPNMELKRRVLLRSLLEPFQEV